MNLSAKQKQTYRFNLWLLGEWVGGRDTQEFGDRQVPTTIFKNRKSTRTDYVAQGTLLNVMWQHECQESLEENGDIYTCG